MHAAVAVDVSRWRTCLWRTSDDSSTTRCPATATGAQHPPGAGGSGAGGAFVPMTYPVAVERGADTMCKVTVNTWDMNTLLVVTDCKFSPRLDSSDSSETYFFFKD